MEILEAILKFKENMEASDKLTEELFEEHDKEKWISLLNKRALTLSTLYEENNKILDYAIHSYTPTEDNASKVYFEMFKLYQGNYDDPSFMIPILEKLEEYYEKIVDSPSRRLVLYSIHSYLAHEYIARLAGNAPLELEIYKKILALKRYYRELDKSQDGIRAYIFIAYYNMVVSSDGLSSISPDETYRYLLEMEEFYHSDIVQELDKDNEFIKDTVFDARLNWLLIHERYNELSKETQDALFEISKEFIEEDIKKSEYQAFMAYHRCLYERHEMDKDSLLKRGIEYLIQKRKDIKAEEDDEMERFVIIFEILNGLVKWLSLEGDANNEYYYSILASFADSILSLKLPRSTPYLNSLFSAFVIYSLPYLEDKSEMEQRIFDNLIRRQAPTYIHSVMVMKIAEVIYEYMDKSLLPKMDNPLEFIQNSALLHDIGKSRITDIINMQRRRLSDFEFGGIKKHPSFGAEILLKNDKLKEYYDIVRGHHKWYNGEGGYPMDFDNTKSKYRMIIDLITIADCLDAATDRYGRNYKRPKTVRDVIMEFEKDKGIRYNPYFVDLLENNQELIYKLEDLTQYKRPEYMYRAYIKGKIGE